MKGNKSIIKQMVSVIAALIITTLALIAISSNTAHAADQTGSITIHKMESNTVYDYDNEGKELDGSTVIGQDSTTGADVTIGSLDTLDGIEFTIVQVEYTNATGDNDDTNVDNYTVTGGYSNTGTTANGGILTFTNLPKGYYLITETANSAIVTPSEPILVSVPITDPSDTTSNLWDVHVYPKNQVEDGPGIDKYVTEVGNMDDTAFYYDNVTWIIQADIPAGIENAARYDVVDKLQSPILRFIESSVVVTLNNGNVVLTEGVDYTIDYIDGHASSTYDVAVNDEFTVVFTESGMAKMAEYVGEKVTITFETNFPYSDMTEDDWNLYLGQSYENEAQLLYTNEFNREWNPVAERPEVHLAGVSLLKVQSSDSTPLAGAKFKIYTSEADALNGVNAVQSPDNTGDWVVSSNASGEVEFYGLEYGNIGQDETEGSTTYWIVEVSAPEGYNLLTEPVEVVVNATSHLTPNAIQVKNSKGFTLPTTGGMGTVWLLAIGAILIAIGAYVIVRFSRNKKTV